MEILAIKKLLSLSLVFLSVTVAAQAPTKLLEVRNGNNIVDNGVSQLFATYIAYKDNAAKQNVIDALCDLGNYDALDPATRPSRQAFANQEIKNWLRDKVKQNRQRLAQLQTPVVDESDLP